MLNNTQFMQKYLFLLVFSLTCLQFAFSQSCNNDFYPIAKGTKHSYESFDKKGKLQSISTSEIQAVESVGDSLKATIRSVTTNEKGKELSTGTVVTVCLDGAIFIDLRSMMANDMTAAFKDGEVLVTGQPLEMPSQLSVGQKLPDGDLTMIMKSGGVQLMKMSFKVSNRVVAAKEKITVKAGSYEAYRITYDLQVESLFKRTVQVEQWMATGVGLVKQVTKDKKGEVENSMELSQFSK
jgi:hypothetical protein